jgi:hypothetical protein
MGSIFVTNPASALQMAQRQLREKASDDLNHYCVEQGVPATAVIERVCGMRVAESRLETLTDEQVAAVWSFVDAVASESARMECSRRLDGE